MAAVSSTDPHFLFQLALTFYRQENAYAKLNYKDNVRLVALSKQATQGSYDTVKPEEPGLLDVVGQDRKAAWKALGEMSKAEAERLFCDELAAHMGGFKAWLDDRLREKAEREERERLEKERLERERLERERLERERLERERQLRIQQEMERQRQERERLAQQHQQFLLLQRQQQQQQQQQQQEGAAAANGGSHAGQRSMSDPALTIPHGLPEAPSGSSAPPSAQKPGGGSKSSIDAAEFRNGLRGSAENELVVGRGEIVTMRVPKPAGRGATRVLWQFSTMDYDIGFGLDFERAGEGGSVVLDPILPVMRMNAQQQVVEGRHESSAEGAWLLKFDNSYSLLRSKTIYYRILFQPL